MLYNILIKNKRAKRKENASQVVFKLKEIGEAVQGLLSGLFQHSFATRPFSSINTEQTKLILDETVIFIFLSKK